MASGAGGRFRSGRTAAASKVSGMARRERRERIFISYRRADSAGHAGRLEDELTRRLGDRVFMDVSDIAPGAEFERVLKDALASCAVVLAVIGPRWKEAFAAPRVGPDYVLMELAQALALEGVQVVPVLVQGASLPSAGELPEAIRSLAGRQAAVIRDDRWADDAAHLARGFRPALGLPSPARRGSVAATLGVLGLGAVAALIALQAPPTPAAYSPSRAREVAIGAVRSAVAACRPAADLVGDCPLVFQFAPDGGARSVYFDSGACILKAPPFGPCVLESLASTRVPPFNDLAEAEVGVGLRLAADGSVTATAEP